MYQNQSSAGDPNAQTNGEAKPEEEIGDSEKDGVKDDKKTEEPVEGEVVN